MEWKGKILIQLLMLVCVLEVSLCQHWSYGWLPGGKRSVGEVEAMIRMMDAGNTVLTIPANSPMDQLSPVHIVNEVHAVGLPRGQRFPNRQGRI
ncbi:progonadoliberin-3-like [Myxocyprinus asiaticus]|uniref:progonadoliberin-3-like n=1 Tax=Myxocyprinus asiaticus TaxID=70543 RepID=UPI0022215105|nr:progonadoliberin-3-like [Myxocyprinus asiaticus]